MKEAPKLAKYAWWSEKSVYRKHGADDERLIQLNNKFELMYKLSIVISFV